ncbi:hypothetical protein DPMN_024247 [Dreissena polymorpha]|uniref:C2H2-type domain-containing protein n=2 Tax=Dreissena polymorpha TaxID=45954 RepID=A0A9D4LM48_DREPO|nr:hypothetical protein DPMN_024247 [Dreissena polymorpha]
MFTDLGVRDSRPQWTSIDNGQWSQDRSRNLYRLHTDHQRDRWNTFRISHRERSHPYPSATALRERRGPADVECKERSQQQPGWQGNDALFKHQVNCLSGKMVPRVDRGFVRINNSCLRERSINSFSVRISDYSVNNQFTLNEQKLSQKGLFVNNIQSNQGLCAEQCKRFDQMPGVEPQWTVEEEMCRGIVPSSQELQPVSQQIPMSLLVLPPPPPPPVSPVIPVTSGTHSCPNYGEGNCVAFKMACSVMQPNMRHSKAAPSLLVRNQPVFATGVPLSESGEDCNRHLTGPDCENTYIPPVEAQDEDIRQALPVSQSTTSIGKTLSGAVANSRNTHSDMHAVNSYASFEHTNIQDMNSKSSKESGNESVAERVCETPRSYFEPLALSVELIPLPSQYDKHCAHGTDIERSCSRRDCWEKDKNMFRPWESQSNSLKTNRDNCDHGRFLCKSNTTSKCDWPVEMNNEQQRVIKSKTEVHNRSAVDTGERKMDQTHKASLSKSSDSSRKEYDHISRNEDAKTQISRENTCVQKADSTSKKAFKRKSDGTRGSKKGLKPIDICQKYKLSSVGMPSIDTRLCSLSTAAYPRVNTSFGSLSTVARPSICLRNNIIESYREFKLTSELFALGKVDKNMRNYHLSQAKSESSNSLKRKKEHDIPFSLDSKKLKVNTTDKEIDFRSIPVSLNSEKATKQTNKDGRYVSRESKLQAMHPKLRHKLPENRSFVCQDSIDTVKKFVGDGDATVRELSRRANVTSSNEIDKSLKIGKDRKLEERSFNGNKNRERFVHISLDKFELKTKLKSTARSSNPNKKVPDIRLTDLKLHLLDKGCQAAKKGLLMRWKSKAADQEDDKMAEKSVDTTTCEFELAKSQDTSERVKPITDTLVDTSACSAENIASLFGAELEVGNFDGSQSSKAVIEAPSSFSLQSSTSRAISQSLHGMIISNTERCKSSVEKERCTENVLDICDSTGLVEGIDKSDLDDTHEVNECIIYTGSSSTGTETSSCMILKSAEAFGQSNGSNESPQPVVANECTFQVAKQLVFEVNACNPEYEQVVNDRKLDKAVCYNQLELDQTKLENNCTSEIVCETTLINEDEKYLQARKELSSINQLPNKSDCKMLPPLLPLCGSSSSVWYCPTLEDFCNYRKSMVERIQADGGDGKFQTEDILSSPEQTSLSDNQQKACATTTKIIETETSKENLTTEIYTATPLHESSFDTSCSYGEEVLNASISSSNSSKSENVNCSQNETQTKDSIFDKNRHAMFSAAENDDFLNLAESNDEILENIVLNMYEDSNLIQDLSDDFAKGDNFEFNDFHDKPETSAADLESVMPNSNPEHEASEDPVEIQKLSEGYEKGFALSECDGFTLQFNRNNAGADSFRNQHNESNDQQENIPSKRRHPKFEKKFPFSLPKAKAKPSELELLASAEKFLQDFDKKNKRTRHESKRVDQSQNECQPSECVKESKNTKGSQIKDEPVKRVTRTHTATMKNKQSKNIVGWEDSSGGKGISDTRGPKETKNTAKSKKDDASKKTVEKDLVALPKLPTLKLKSLKHINQKKMWSFKEATNIKSTESAISNKEDDTMSDSGMMKNSKKSRTEMEQCGGGKSDPDNDSRNSNQSADSEDLNEKKKQFLSQVLTCKVCGLVGERKEEVDQHYLRQHPGWCLSCSKLFESVELLNLHKKRNHDVLICCGVCNSVFCYKAHYMRHMTSSIHAKNLKEFQKRRQQQQRGLLHTVTISSDDENGEESHPRNVNHEEETIKRKFDIKDGKKTLKKQKTHEKDPKLHKNAAKRVFDPKGETTEDGLVLCLACQKYYKYFNKHLKSQMHENNVNSIVIEDSDESELDEENEDKSIEKEIDEVISLKSSPHASETSCTYNSDATDWEDGSAEQSQHSGTLNCGMDSENVLEEGCYDVVQNRNILKLKLRPVNTVDLIKARDHKAKMCSPALLIKNISADMNNNEHCQIYRFPSDREEKDTSVSTNKIDINIVKSAGSNVIEIIDNLAADNSDTEMIFEGVDMDCSKHFYSYHDNDIDQDCMYTCSSAVDDPILEGFCVIENVETLSKESFRLDGNNESAGNRCGLDPLVDVSTDTGEMIEMLAQQIEQNLPRTSL